MAIPLKMEIKTLEKPRVLDVIMEGDIDNPNNLAPLETAVMEFKGKGVMLNMKHVTYLNSAGFGEIMNIAELCTKKKMPMLICNADEKIRSVFECLAAGFFKMFASEHEALKVLA